jgi:DNA-binding GntR family transcriptional regulator
LTIELLSNVGRSAVREHALDCLRSAITSGQYRPGDDLSEVELAQHLGVGRGTVRQALRHLQQEGLVTAGKRSMLRVKNLSALEVRELFRVWAALEGLAVRQLMASPDVATSVRKLRRRPGSPTLTGTSRDGSRLTSASICSCAGCPATPCSSRPGDSWKVGSGL